MKMNDLDMTRIPGHIAIIMDGNGRWATLQGKPRSDGHQAGVETVRRITSECTRLGVKYLTLYTFSTENWNRPADEVAALMGLVLSSLEDEIFMKNNVRFQVIGDIGRLPESVQQKLKETIEHTAGNSAMTMVVAGAVGEGERCKGRSAEHCEGSEPFSRKTAEAKSVHYVAYVFEKEVEKPRKVVDRQQTA